MGLALTSYYLLVPCSLLPRLGPVTDIRGSEIFSSYCQAPHCLFRGLFLSLFHERILTGSEKVVADIENNTAKARRLGQMLYDPRQHSDHRYQLQRANIDR